MNMTAINYYLLHYGMIFLFILFLLEYLNAPGLSAGIIMPLSGIWVKEYGQSIILAIIVSVMGGIIGSIILYGIGRFCGKHIIDKWFYKDKKKKGYITKKIDFLKEKGAIGVFISMFIPGIRTIVSIPAGALKINILEYLLFLFFAVLIWNTTLILSGYFLGSAVFSYLKIM